MSQPNDTPAPVGSDRTDDEHLEPTKAEQTDTEQTDTEQTEDTRVIQTDHPETGSQPSEQLPTGHTPADQPPLEPAAGVRPSGPHLPAILLGLACLVIAGLAMAQELGHLQIDWGNVGPLGIVAAGAVLVVLGLVGLLTSRRRDTN